MENNKIDAKAGLAFLHPIAAIIVVAIDLLWTIIEVAALPLLIAWCIIIFIATAITVYKIQKILAEESEPKAKLKGIVFGILVALPFPIFGVAGGVAALVASFIDFLTGASGKKQNIS